MIQVSSIPYAFGVDPACETLPIVNLPEDTLRVKRRLRPGKFATAFVKTADGCREYYLMLENGELRLGDVLRANINYAN